MSSKYNLLQGKKQKKKMSETRKLQDTIKSKFIKDYSLPVTILEDKYFNYLIDLYEPVLKSKTKLKEYLQVMEDAGGESKFFAECKEFIKNFHKTIHDLEEYKEFSNNDFKKYQFKSKIKGITVYSAENEDKHFISVDMSSANFNCLKYHNPSKFTILNFKNSF